MAVPPTKRGVRRPVRKFASAAWDDFAMPDLSRHFRGDAIDVVAFSQWLEPRVSSLRDTAMARELISEPAEDEQALTTLADRAGDLCTLLSPDGLPLRADMHLTLALDTAMGPQAIARLRKELECLERAALTARSKVIHGKAGAKSKARRDDLIADMVAIFRKSEIKLAAAKSMTLDILKECGLTDLPIGDEAMKKAIQRGG